MGDIEAVKRRRMKRWQSLKKDMNTKLQLLMNTLEQDSRQPVLSNNIYINCVFQNQEFRLDVCMASYILGAKTEIVFILLTIYI